MEFNEFVTDLNRLKPEWSQSYIALWSTIKYNIKGSYLLLTCVPSRPANGESFTPNVIDIVGGSNSIVGRAAIT